MGRLIYREPEQMTPEEAEAALDSGDLERIVGALWSLSLNGDDHVRAESAVRRFLGSENLVLRDVAIRCAGAIAREFQCLSDDLRESVKALASEPGLEASVGIALSDIRLVYRDPPELTLSDALSALDSGDEERIVGALWALSLYGDDRARAEASVRRFLESDSLAIREVAIRCAGAIAREFGCLSADVIDAVKSSASEPALDVAVSETLNEVDCFADIVDEARRPVGDERN